MPAPKGQAQPGCDTTPPAPALGREARLGSQSRDQRSSVSGCQHRGAAAKEVPGLCALSEIGCWPRWTWSEPAGLLLGNGEAPVQIPPPMEAGRLAVGHLAHPGRIAVRLQQRERGQQLWAPSGEGGRRGVDGLEGKSSVLEEAGICIWGGRGCRGPHQESHTKGHYAGRCIPGGHTTRLSQAPQHSHRASPRSHRTELLLMSLRKIRSPQFKLCLRHWAYFWEDLIIYSRTDLRRLCLSQLLTEELSAVSCLHLCQD